jgi:hypothetical protein
VSKNRGQGPSASATTTRPRRSTATSVPSPRLGAASRSSLGSAPTSASHPSGPAAKSCGSPSATAARGQRTSRPRLARTKDEHSPPAQRAPLNVVAEQALRRRSVASCNGTACAKQGDLDASARHRPPGWVISRAVGRLAVLAAASLLRPRPRPHPAAGRLSRQLIRGGWDSRSATQVGHRRAVGCRATTTASPYSPPGARPNRMSSASGGGFGRGRTMTFSLHSTDALEDKA